MMKLFAVLALLLGSLVSAHGAETTVNAPQAQATNTITVTDWSLAGGLIAGRALDWASTEECLRRTYCHEAELPSTLVHSMVALRAFEAGAAGVSILLQRYETQHDHRKLARAVAVAVFDLSMVGAVQVHNYQVPR
jgi:hypothetical protein